MEQPYAPPPVRQGYNLALASLITGIVVLLLGCCIPFIGLPLGVVAIILGAMALKAIGRDEDHSDSSRTMAIVGIVLGSFAALYGVASGLWLIFFAQRFVTPWPGMPGGRPPMFQ